MAGIDGILKTAIKKGEPEFAIVLLRHTLAQRFYRYNLYLLNHIFLYIENIDIVLLNAHARASNRNFLQRLQNHPLTVRASSSGRCQLNALLISRTLAVPSIMTEPSFCGVTSSASVGDIDVVKSPTISSRISSTVTSPWISPYSLTTSPTFFYCAEI